MWLNFLSAWGIFCLAVWLPGPNTFLAASIGIKGNLKIVCIASLGIAIGSAFWCFVATTGISLLIAQNLGVGFIFLKISASIYMFYLAYQSMRQYLFTNQDFIKSTSYLNNFEYFFKGLITTMTNPKAFAFWSALGLLKFQNPLALNEAVIFSIGTYFLSALSYSFMGYIFTIGNISNYLNKPKSIINLIFTGLFLFVGIEIWILT
jgi:threonine/homoserine/homoserine lactone efflux protein|tara:strand:+ start:5160 stop:5777 length:618 start_codon:yes stop_codon:yes gene_type:complete